MEQAHGFRKLVDPKAELLLSACRILALSTNCLEIVLNLISIVLKLSWGAISVHYCLMVWCHTQGKMHTLCSEPKLKQSHTTWHMWAIPAMSQIHHNIDYEFLVIEIQKPSSLVHITFTQSLTWSGYPHRRSWSHIEEALSVGSQGDIKSGDGGFRDCAVCLHFSRSLFPGT